MSDKKYGSLKYVAVDFDNTITEHAEFPNIGNLRYGARDVLLDLKAHGLIIIIWTCRTGRYQDTLKMWLIDNQIPFDYINENPACPDANQKIFADAYIDDRAVAFDGNFERLQTDLIAAGALWPEHVIVPPNSITPAQLQVDVDALRYKLNSEMPTEEVIAYLLSNYKITPIKA